MRDSVSFYKQILIEYVLRKKENRWEQAYIALGMVCAQMDHVLLARGDYSLSFQHADFNNLLRFAQHGRKQLARIPLKGSQVVSYRVLAIMSFTRWVRNIPTPKILAWNASYDNPVGVPYVLQEHIDNVAEPSQVWGKASDSTHSSPLSSNHFHAP